jgi:hypothetical protein
MSLKKLSLAGNNLIIPDQGEFGKDIPAGDGKISNLFLQCSGGVELSGPCLSGRSQTTKNINSTGTKHQKYLQSLMIKGMIIHDDKSSELSVFLLSQESEML